ncbi:MFS transporter [Chelativorans salis]|uniref:MFS transporter n=1 Tax=Chelativorans salis TaxID=2978478 RepID=A0ABT2LH32_9HYPH|nr:MFS transporter [Chelativorans sp. EGI FJ00035]MCT7373733.1 MFS transporter [Chelativorans sp. EGI FJ00035]
MLDSTTASKGTGIGRPGVHIAPVATLLASVGLLVLGNGLQGTLLVVRAGQEGFRSETIGLMMSAYFAGYALGSVVLPRVVSSAGHIRAFAGFASIASATALLHLLLLDAWAWSVLRAVTGFAYAGMILVTESWLNAHAVTSTRGRLLSIYGMITMGIWALGQGLLNVAPPEGVVLFLIVSILISLALVPITLLPSRPPTVPHQVGFDLSRLFAMSPLGTLGAFLSGLALSAFWGMGPNFAQEVGLDTAGISAFMAAVLFGALFLQWPLGWLSDRYPRRLVIAFSALAAALAGIGFVFIADAGLPALLSLGFVFGGFGIPLYTLVVAHANDRLKADEMLAAARGLLLLNGLGAAFGPFVAGLSMRLLGPTGLFVYAAILLTILALAAFLRRLHGPEEEAVSSPLPCTPQIAMTLDTRGHEPRAERA